MDEVVNKLLLAEDQVVLVENLPNSKEEYKKFKETAGSRYNYQNELDKACFQHDIANGDFKDFSRRMASDILLSDKAFNIAKKSQI